MRAARQASARQIEPHGVLVKANASGGNRHAVDCSPDEAQRNPGLRSLRVGPGFRFIRATLATVDHQIKTVGQKVSFEQTLWFQSCEQIGRRASAFRQVPILRTL